MSKLLRPIILVGGLIISMSFLQSGEKTSYKCMIQTINYDGEGAYIIISLINPDGDYDQTLYVFGDDPEWYHEIDEWWSFFGKKKRDIDGVTGPTMSGGERKIITVQVDNSKIDQGYKIRFESSVEDQQYYPKDLEIALERPMPTKPLEGLGYVRYVRMIPNG